MRIIKSYLVMNIKSFPINMLVMKGFVFWPYKSRHFDTTRSVMLGALEVIEVFLFRLDQEIDLAFNSPISPML